MFTIPNIFSIIRILLIIPVIYFLNSREYLIAFYLIIAAGLTDFFDGYFARKLNQITGAGKILDPLADKLFIDIVAIFLAIKMNFPIWFTALIIGRDLLILIAGYIVIKKKKFIAQSNMIGKVTFTVIVSSAAAYIIDLDFLKLPLIYLGTFFIILSMISYGRKIYLNFKKNNNTTEDTKHKKND